MFPGPDHIKISHGPRALAELTGEAPPSVAWLRRLAADGRIPADLLNEHWYLRRSDLPAIAVLVRHYQERAGKRSAAVEPTTLVLP